MAKKVTIEIEARFTENGLDGVVKKAEQAEKSVNNLKKSIENTGKGTGASKPFDSMTSSATKAEKAIEKTKKSVDKLTKTKADINVTAKDKASAVLNKVKGLAKSFGNGMYKAGVYVTDRASSVLSKIKGNLGNITSKAWRVAVSIKDNVTGTLSSITNKLFSIKTLIAGIMGGMAVNKLALQPIAFADQMENSLIGFTTLLGSGTKAAEMIADIKDFARTTPLDTSGTISSIQQMLNAGIGSAEKYNADGTENQNYVMKMIEKIGNAASASGGGTEAMKGITLALSQMSMTGKVNAQDMMQLANRNIPAWKMLAEYFGTSVQAVREMSRDGEITAEQGIEAIMQGMEKYDGMMNMLSTRTASGIWSNIKDTFQLSIIEKWGRGLQSGAIKGLRDFAGWLDRISPLLDNAGASLEKIGEYISTNLFDGFEGIYSKVEEILRSDDFIHADGIGSKMKVLFGELWHSFTGWLTEKAPDIGKFMGSALSKGITGIADFITGALGGDTSGLDNAASNMGSTFWEAFCDAFDSKKVVAALKRAVGAVFSSLGKFLPGGESPDVGSFISAYMIGKPLLASGLLGGGMSLAGKGAKAAGKGLLGWGNTLGTAAGLSGTAATVAGTTAMAGYAVGIGTLWSAGNDFSNAYNLHQASKQTEGKDTKRLQEIERNQNIIKGSIKTGGTVAGMALGAKYLGTAGAAIGSAIPGLGTVIGAGIGTLIGAVGGALAGTFLGDKYEEWQIEKLNDSRIKEGKLGTSDAALEFAANYGIDWETAVFKSKEMKDAIKDTTLSAEELGAVFEKTISEDMASRFGDVSLALEDIDEMAKRIVLGDSLDDMETYMAAVIETEQALSSFAQAKYSVDKWNIKASVGLDVKDDNIDQFTADVGSFVKYAETYLENSQFEFNVGAKFIFGDITEGDGKAITESTTAFYNQLIKQVEDLEIQIDEKIKLASADGIITVDEQTEITNLTNQINDIVQKIADAESKAELELIKLKFGNIEMTDQNFLDMQESIMEWAQTSADNADDAYIKMRAVLDLQLESATTEEEKTKIQGQIDTLTQEYLKGYEERNKQSIDMQIEIIANAYMPELGGTAEKAVANLNSAIQYALTNDTDPITWDTATLASKLNITGDLDETVASQLRTVLSNAFNTHTESTQVEVPVTVEPVVEKYDWSSFPSLEGGNLLTPQLSPIITSMPLVVDWNLTNQFEAPENVTGTTKADVETNTSWNLTPEEPTFGPFSTTTTANVTVKTNFTTVGSYKLPSLGNYSVLNNAKGGFVNGSKGAQLSWLTEEGYDESIIPLNPARHDRAVDIWAETGRRLGVLNNAEGGIVSGINPYEPPSSDININSNSGGGTVSVQMEKGSVSINITADSSQTVSEAIDSQKEAIAEQVAAIMAKVIGSQFANKPMRA